MDNEQEQTMHHLIDEYRRHVVERGDKPKPVWCMVSTGGVQPVGYLLGWSINKREIERRAAERGDCAVVRAA